MVKFHLIQDTFTVEAIKTHKEPIPLSTQEQIDTIWHALKEEQEFLFNGQLLSAITFTPEKLVGEFVEYKHYLAQEIDPNLRKVLQISPVCITCLTMHDNLILVGKRSQQVSTNQGAYELIPSGSVDTAYYHQGTVDIKKLMLHELDEEAGITTISSLQLCGVMHSNNIYEICGKIILPQKFDPKSRGEHDQLLWLSKEDILSLENLLPESKFFLLS